MLLFNWFLWFCGIFGELTIKMDNWRRRMTEFVYCFIKSCRLSPNTAPKTTFHFQSTGELEKFIEILSLRFSCFLFFFRFFILILVFIDVLFIQVIRWQIFDKRTCQLRRRCIKAFIKDLFCYCCYCCMQLTWHKAIAENGSDFIFSYFLPN